MNQMVTRAIGLLELVQFHHYIIHRVGNTFETRCCERGRLDDIRGGGMGRTKSLVKIWHQISSRVILIVAASDINTLPIFPQYLLKFIVHYHLGSHDIFYVPKVNTKIYILCADVFPIFGNVFFNGNISDIFKCVVIILTYISKWFFLAVV